MYKYNLINLENIINYEYEDIKDYFRYNGIEKFDQCDIEVLKELSGKLSNKSGFNISYIINRLDKEFDLIKVGNKKLINIELKLTEKDVDQCEDNYKTLRKYYNGYEISVFCYEKSKNKVYKYDNKFKVLSDSTIEDLNKELEKIINPVVVDINFNVIPVYQNPEYCITHNYKLSQAQEKTKEKILKSSDKCIIVTGRAGTGKTLLALDLYAHYILNKSTCVFLGLFKVNDLINQDLRKLYRIMTENEFCKKPKEYDYIIIDEAQRINKASFLVIQKYATKKLILFGDINQGIDNESYFSELYEDDRYTKYNINTVIRSDDTFDIFARKVLGISTKSVKIKNMDFSKIKILMKDDNLPDLSEYVFIEPAKSIKYSNCENGCENKLCQKIGSMCSRYESTYNIIGQEYKKVVISMCHKYYIDSDNKLRAMSRVCYGDLKSQLYTIMTRTVDELIIIVDNIKLYNFLTKKIEEAKLK